MDDGQEFDALLTVMDDVGLSRRTPTGPTLRTPEVGGVGMEAQGGQLPVKIGRISIVFMNLAHFPWGHGALGQFCGNWQSLEFPQKSCKIPLTSSAEVFS